MLGHGNRGGWLGHYLDDPEFILQSFASTLTDVGGLARQLWRGSLPGLLDMADEAVPDYLRSYVETYIERDVRTAGDIRELAVFSRFLGLAAALTAQEINSSQFGRELGVKPDTARTWTDLLTATFQWRELLSWARFYPQGSKRFSASSLGLPEDYCLSGGWRTRKLRQFPRVKSTRHWISFS